MAGYRVTLNINLVLSYTLNTVTLKITYSVFLCLQLCRMHYHALLYLRIYDRLSDVSTVLVTKSTHMKC